MHPSETVTAPSPVDTESPRADHLEAARLHRAGAMRALLAGPPSTERVMLALAPGHFFLGLTAILPFAELRRHDPAWFRLALAGLVTCWLARIPYRAALSATKKSPARVAAGLCFPLGWLNAILTSAIVLPQWNPAIGLMIALFATIWALPFSFAFAIVAGPLSEALRELHERGTNAARERAVMLVGLHWLASAAAAGLIVALANTREHQLIVAPLHLLGACGAALLLFGVWMGQRRERHLAQLARGEYEGLRLAPVWEVDLDEEALDELPRLTFEPRAQVLLMQEPSVGRGAYRETVPERPIATA